MGGVDAASLATIEEQIQTEVGAYWTSDPTITRGRNAVRAEHGLPLLGAPPEKPVPERSPRWRRLLGR